jgi:rSAM/selenodomain-associated transferase 2/rSAM/selenodomain-associated transferase 1
MAVKPPVLVFTRFPAPDQSKTRLISALGAEGAAEFQRLLTEHTVITVRRAGFPASIHYAGASRRKFQGWLGPGLDYWEQIGTDLGQRMAKGLNRVFQQGSGPCVLIGCDCPEISAELLAEAFTRLEDHEVVLGPATDGGYYLIGLQRPVPELFEKIVWGTADVCEQTASHCQRLNLKTAFLKTLPDVDWPDDLAAAENALRQNDSPRISVIIPALNEAARIRQTLASAFQAPGVEVLVVDCGSSDSTQAVARELGAKVLSAPRGRGQQMNAGAAKATGGILLFLHADTLLPKRYDITVRHTLAQPDTSLGAFSLALDAHPAGLDAITLWANRRSQWLGLPYGDQAFFMQKTTFTDAGGFAETPILEDYLLARRLGKYGCVRIAKAAVVTSARRWQTAGVWRTFLLNQAILAGYFIGISPKRLARWRP